MKAKVVFVRSLLTGGAMAFGAVSGCSSLTGQRVEGDIAASRQGEKQVPVKMVDGGSGCVESARVRAYGKTAYVTGFVRRVTMGDPQPGAHVDVLVMDAREKLVETRVATYLPRAIPHGHRGVLPRSSYAVRLAKHPEPGAMVKVIFHDASAAHCKFNDDGSAL